MREAAKDADPSTFGRIERLFLAFGQVGEVEARLRSIQVTQHFDERRERLANHTKTLRDACEQVRASPKLRTLLKLILTIGNYLNGASARGGAYGFRLADLEKLRHVRSTNLNTTLLLPGQAAAGWPTVWIRAKVDTIVFAAKTLVSRCDRSSHLSKEQPRREVWRGPQGQGGGEGQPRRRRLQRRRRLERPLGLLLEQFAIRPVFEALATDLSAMECEIKSLARSLPSRLPPQGPRAVIPS